ncbi:hypothetical protein N1027_06165 [Herbiconiux sp. CPCC 205763]|uniref:Stage II sporulation protein M n=1 Tax=Herbiconiux aconitum TaxID=2970913 RepID=A0ABT2GNA5_9MICO|nr:hypothetical protein [Herbiconiux aconitum]MCS5717717.1 hypothetical protein [Herbiconiux aconitum]
MQLIRKPFGIIRENLRIYLVLNALAYGLFLVGFAIGLIFPDLSAGRAEALENDGTADLVLSLISNPWLFALVILLVNTFQLSLLTIVLPSLIIPFSGIVAFSVWVVITGVTLVPADGAGWVALIPHSLTLIIELQAYILVLTGVFLLGKFWLRPRSIGAANHRTGYLRGLQHLGRLAVPAFLLLIVGAIWEAFSLIYLVHPLQQWLL